MLTIHVATRASLLSQHAVHVLAFGVPALMVLVGLTWDSLRRRSARSGDQLPMSSPLLVAAVAGIAAAVVHVVVAPEHFHESAVYGAFFVVTAAAQVGGALLLVVRRSRPLTGLVAGGNGSVIALWLVTRIVGIPLGPAAGTVEPFQRLDVAASSCEAIVVICCLAVLYRGASLTRSLPVS